MRRKIYFLLERLNITPGERRLVLTAASAIVLLSLGLTFIHPRPQYNRAYYAPLIRQFREKIKEARKRDSLKKAPYYKLKALNAEIKKDTLNRGKKQEKPASGKGNSDVRININTAGADSLVLLPGIGPKTAGKIINYRKVNGPFKTLGSIKKVKGIADKKLEKITPYIQLE